MIPKEPDAEARRTRAIVGAIFAVVCVGALGIFVYSVSHTFEQVVRMSKGAEPDPSQLLDTSGLGAGKLVEVVHHYRFEGPKGDPSGKITEVYALRLSDVEIAALTSQKTRAGAIWHRGDELPPAVSDAVTAALAPVPGFHLGWLPREEELRSEHMYAFSWLIYYRGDEMKSVRLGFLRPSDHMFFYFSRSDPVTLLAEGMANVNEAESHSR